MSQKPLLSTVEVTPTETTQKVTIDIPLEDFKVRPFQRENVIQGYVSNYDWSAAWLTAISIAWSDDKLKHDLLTDPATFLRLHCAFDVPPSLHLVVREDTSSEFVPRTGDVLNRPVDWEWYLSPQVVVMSLPNKPEDPSQVPVALAAYQAVGITYPFSTC